MFGEKNPSRSLFFYGMASLMTFHKLFIFQLLREGRANRSKSFLEISELLACGPKLLASEGVSAERKREEVLDLLAVVSRRDRTIFKDLLRTHKSVIADVMRLSPQKASSLQHSLKMTVSMRRKLSTACIKLFGFTFMPGEKLQREFEAEVCKAFSNDKLERGSMMLLKSTKDTAPRPCYFARVINLPEYLAGEVRKAMDEVFEDPDCMANLLSPKHEGALKVAMGGDKGGQTTKITVILGGCREPLCVGLFFATDCSPNLLRFFGDWIGQLRDLKEQGLRIRLEDGTSRHFPVKLLLNGDKLFQSAMCGHSGSSSTMPSLYRKILRSHLQNDHRNGEPHLPSEEKCQAAWRDMEGMAKSYSQNLAASNNDPEKMRKKAAKFDSIKGPQIVPLPSIWNLVPPGLHYSLLIGTVAPSFLGLWCDVLDGQVDEAVLAKVVDVFDMAEEGSEEEGEGLDESTGQEPGAATDPKTGHSEAREKLEQEVVEAEMEVMEADVLVQKLNQEVLDRLVILKRVEVNLAADVLKKAGKDEEAKERWTFLEQLVKGNSSNKRFLETFRYCGDFCLMTGHDHGIKEELCSGCNLICHSECELWDPLEAAAPPAAAPAPAAAAAGDEAAEEEEGGAMEGQEGGLGGLVELRTCNNCRPRTFKSFQEMEEIVRPWVEEGQGKRLAAEVVLERARARQQVKTEELKYVVGPRRRELIRLLEEELHVTKTAYQGGTYVGNHCSKMLENHEKLSVVLASKPELQELFNLFCSTYLRIHRTMKAARWLTEKEIDTLEEDCHAIGRLWPKLFMGSTIKPKIDDIVFVVPTFARTWKTVGGLGEERIENLHQVFNTYGRILAPMRHKGEMVVVALRREAIFRVVGNCTIPTPRKRKFGET